MPVITWPTGVSGTVGPGQAATGTATYTIKQSDVDAGSVANSATVSGRTPQNVTVTSDPSVASVPTAAASRLLSVTKSASITSGARAGDAILYTLSITNSGNQTLTDVVLTDSLAGLSTPVVSWPGPTNTLGPGQTATATASYAVTQADVDSGSVANTATATATAPGNVPVSGTSPEVVTTTVAASPSISLVKTGALAPGSQSRVGDVVNYTFTLRNTGNVTVTGATISDPMPGLSALAVGTWPTATAGTLPPNTQVTATASYTLTQSDVDGGSVANTAAAAAQPPTGAPLAATSSATVPLSAGAALTVSKTGAVTSGSGAVGDTVTFSFVVRNTGNVTLETVAVTDTLSGLSPLTYGTWPSGVDGQLLPNTQVTATATYVIGQSDVNAGSVRNTATASGTPPVGPAVTATSGEAVVATVASAPSITTTKTSSVSGTGAVGETVTYTIVGRNSGNVTFTGVTLSDPLAGLSTPVLVWSGAPTVLEPGEIVTATATRTVLQSDVDAGSIANTATVTGTPPTGAAVSGSASRTTQTAASTPRITVTKSGSLPLPARGVAGDVVTWDMTVANTGNVTLSGVSITDAQPGISSVSYGTWSSGTAFVLRPGDSTTATATYTLTQADVDAGAVSNTATATGTPPRGAAPTATAPATLALTPDARITLGKTAAYVGAGTGAVGDTLQFTFTASNPGTVTLTGVTISDPHQGLGPLAYGTWASGVAGTLAPGQSITATADYVVTQADVNAGAILNQASVIGRPPTGAAVTASSAAVSTPTIARSASIVTTKTSVVSGTGAVGDVITYTLGATNTGTVTITGVSFTDSAPGLSPLVYSAWPSGVTGTLQPGDLVTATTRHVITQADVNAQSVSNAATASGTSQVSPVVSNTSPTVTDPTAAANPQLSFTKSGTLATTATAGSRVNYTFTTTNTGNQTLTGVSVADPLPGLSPLVASWPTATAGTLQPGQTATFTAFVILTQADVDAGSISNLATATATPPAGPNLTPTAASTVPLSATSAITVTKTAVVNGDGELGDTVDYTFTIANPGNVTLSAVTLVDPLDGLSTPTITWPTPTDGVLPPGRSAVATASYTLTQADIDAGSVTNTASATGQPPGAAAPVMASSGPVVVSTGAGRAELTTLKTVTSTGTPGLGEQISYEFRVTNTGNVTIDDVTLIDPFLGIATPTLSFPTTPGSLAPDEFATATIDYTVTQQDVDAGSVVNTATSSGLAPGLVPVTSAPSSVTTVTEAADPRILVTKSASAVEVAGDVVTWSFTLSNPGNVTLTGVTLVDSIPSATPTIDTWQSGVAGQLDPGDTITVTSETTVTQADVDAGSLVNTVTASGTPPQGGTATSTATATAPLAPNGGLRLTKTAVSPAPVVVGSIVTYDFLVENTGNLTITDITISDELDGLGAISYTDWDGNPVGTLGPGDELIATADYEVTQSDVDAGGVENSASATGIVPGGQGITSPPSEVSVTTVTRDPELTTTKSGSLAGTGVVGDVITFTITVENTGNTSVESVIVADTLAGLSPLDFDDWPRSTAGLLLPGDVVTATATYAITQADVDAGSVSNTATGSGVVAVTGAPVSDASDPALVPTATAITTIEVLKSGALEAGATGRAGDDIQYTFTLRNTGNVTMTDVGFTDPLVDIDDGSYVWPASAPAGSLRPGATVTATGSYTITQADVDSGSVANIVTGSATPPGVGQAAITEIASATVPLAEDASLSAVKTGTLRPGAIGALGDIIDYVVTVTNTGNVTVHDGQLLDPLPGISAPVIEWPDPANPGLLPVGQSVTGRASYALQQQDIDRGYISNIADVSALTPTDELVLATTNEVIVPTVQPVGALAVDKSASVSGTAKLGDVITYTFTVTNAGNVTIDGIELSDPLPGLSTITLPWGSNTAHALAPGASIATTATRTITQDDINAGEIRNVATATGATPSDVPVTARSAEVVTPTIAAAPGISVTKSGALPLGASGVAGDVITYDFVVANTGNVRLTAVDLIDAMPALSSLAFGTWPTASAGVLDPGQSVSASASYTLLQSDVDAGSVANSVTATGTPPRGAAVSTTTPETVVIASDPDLLVTKSGSLGAQDGSLGDTVTYTFTVTNTGNVTVSGVLLTDTKQGVSAPVFTWPGAPGVLAPGEVATATSSYQVTQADIDDGAVENTATATARTPFGALISRASPLEVTPTIAREGELEVTKVGTVEGSGTAGSNVRYDFTISNTGTVTVTDVVLTDTKTGLSTPQISWPGAPGVLLPGQTATATASYALLQSDVDAGSTTNSASVDGTSAVGPVSDDTGTVTTPTAAADPALTVTKDGALAAGSTGRAGDVIQYSISIANTGNVTLDTVEIADPLVDLGTAVITWPSAPGVLAPNQAVTVVVDYELTQEDVDNGLVSNTASATGEPPTGDAVGDSDTADVTITPAPVLTPVKSAVLLNGGTGAVGDIIEYTLRITNDGNVTLHDGRLLDPLPGLGIPVIDWPIDSQPGVVPPGQAVVGVATYALQQQDIDRGFISNIADVSAVTPAGVTVLATSNEVIVPTVLAAPGIVVSKVGTLRAGGAVGDTIDYAFAIRNSGNVTLDGVTLTDPLTGVVVDDIVWPRPAFPGVLRPGDVATAGGSYVVQQSDVDAGSVINTATASGSSPTDVVVSADSLPSTVPTQTAAADLSITKSAALASAGRQDVGDLVTWSYVLTNTGNVTLSAVELTDALPGISGLVYDWDGAPFVLLPGESVRATATSALTQAQIDEGRVESAVTGVGTPEQGAVVSRTTEAGVDIAAVPDLAVEKSGVPRAGGVLGDVIDYEFRIDNPGNVTLSLVDVTDALQGVSSPVFTWNGTPGILAPGEFVIATAEYTVTQQDVDAGTVVNVATASGKPPVGPVIQASSPISTTTLAPATAELVVTKDAVTGTGSGVNGVIEYEFTITNTGDLTLRDVTLDDPLVGLSTPVIRWPGEVGVLAPGDVATATASYVITQTDVNAGSVANTVTADALTVGGAAVESDEASTTTATASATPALSLDATGALAPGATGRIGDRVEYSFLITNSGNQTLTAVDLTTTLTGLAGLAFVTAGFPGGTLQPGDTAVATAYYVLTAADVDAGSVALTATTAGSSPTAVVVDASDPVTVLIPEVASLSAVKTGTLQPGGIGALGDVIDYVVTVTNTGNVTVTQGQLLDPLPGISTPVIEWPDPANPGVLPAGQSVVGRASYPLQQQDIDRGYIANIADVSARTPTNQLVLATTNEVIVPTVQPQPGVTVTKAGSASGTAAVNDTVSYDFVITNTGNVTIGSIALADPMAGLSAPVIQWPTADRTLPPGGTVGATATYTITQDDVDAGAVTNTATVDAVPVRGDAVSALSNTSVVPTAPGVVAVSITNSGARDQAGPAVAGNTVTWSYVLTNTGTVTLRGVDLADSLGVVPSGDYVWSGTPGELAPGGTLTATRSQTVTQSDVDAGSVSSIVTGSGAPLVGAAATATAPATVPLLSQPVVTVSQVGSPTIAGQVGLGDEITYTFTVENTGNVTLDNVVLTDLLPGAVVTDIVWSTATAGTLAPSGVAVVTVTYVLQQEDIDAGSVDNVGRVTATEPNGLEVTADSNLVSIPLETHDPSITTTAVGAVTSGGGAAGSVIRYDYVITNTGNVTLSLVEIRQALVGISGAVVDFPSTSNILAPGATATATATYTVTQQDVDTGTVTNGATSYGTSPTGVIVTGVSNVVTTTLPAPAPALTAAHTAALAAGATGVLGDSMDYTFTLTNTGTVTLTGVDMTNSVAGLTGITPTWPTATAGRLEPGQSVTYTATRTVTQADVDAGVVRNITTATGTDPFSTVATATSEQSEVALATATGTFDVAKAATVRGGGPAVAGATVDYTITVTNAGTLTVSGVAVTDTKPGLSPLVVGAWPTATAGVLPPGTSVEVSTSVVIAQAEFDAGSVRNTASASGTLPGGAAVSATSPESVLPTQAGSSSIGLTKTQVLAAGATGSAGDVVEFRFEVTNTGDFTLSGVVLTDAQLSLGPITIAWPTATAGVLPPGATAVGTAQYTLTQADVDAGSISSLATTQGSPVVGAPVSATASGTTLIAASPSMTIDKSSTLATFAQQGARVDYLIEVVNTGNVTLTAVDVTDSLVGLSTPVFNWPGTPGSLVPGAVLEVRASYTILQSDIDAGSISNTATASATAGGVPLAPVADTDLLLTPAVDAIVLEVSLALAAGHAGYAGDTVVVTYRVTNSGTSRLTGIDVSDARVGLSPLSYGPWPGTPGILEPGQSIVLTATFTITAADQGRLLTETAQVVASEFASGDPVSVSDAGSLQLPTVPAALPLARSGVEIAGASIASLLLLMGGLGLLLVARRRRRKEHA